MKNKNISQEQRNKLKDINMDYSDPRFCAYLSRSYDTTYMYSIESENFRKEHDDEIRDSVPLRAIEIEVLKIIGNTCQVYRWNNLRELCLVYRQPDNETMFRWELLKEIKIPN